MESKIEVRSINLTIGKKEISLTIDEAKKLKTALNALFEEKTVIKEIHHHENKKWFWDYYQPIFLYQQNNQPYFEVTCASQQNGIAKLMAKID